MALNFTPKCVATTGDAFCHTAQFSDTSTRLPKSNCFRSAQFSADGTAIITHNEDQRLRTFVLPTDLLDPRDEPQVLSHYSTYKAGSNIQAYALYPNFNLQDPASTLVLSASADVPITLRNALQFDNIQSRYKFINAQTEAHLRPTSLAFTREGNHFIAGSDNALALFDCHRDGEGPVSEQRLTASKKGRPHTDTWSLSRGGHVSTMSISSGGVVAVGTWLREVALYDQESLGQCSSAFSLDAGSGIGITDLRWSPDGTYLLVAERQADSILVYDIRYQQRMVASLSGRNAKTTQKLGMNLIPTAAGYEVWAGGIDGSLRMWSNPGSIEGDHAPDATIPAMHQAPITSPVWHPTGVVLATCSGQEIPRHSAPLRIDQDHSDTSSDLSSDTTESGSSDATSDTSSEDAENLIPDNTLRIWSV